VLSNFAFKFNLRRYTMLQSISVLLQYKEYVRVFEAGAYNRSHFRST
jgi:hypothetical protein